MTTVWVNIATGVYHRDPGCTRLCMIKRRENIRRTSTADERAKKPCSYCHSRAGYRRYP